MEWQRVQPQPQEGLVLLRQLEILSPNTKKKGRT